MSAEISDQRPLPHLSNFAIWQRMMRYLRPYRHWAFIAFVGIVGANVLAVAIPYILRQVIDVGIASGEASYMLNARLLVIGLGILRGLMGFLSRYFGERLSHHIAYDIRNEMYDKVLRLQFAYHDNAQVGTIITRAISDVSEVQRYFGFGLIDGLNTFILLGGVSVVMFTSSPILALIALTPMIPLAFLSKNFILRVDPRWRIVMERTQKLSNQLQETALGAQVVRAFAREPYEISRWHDNTEKLYQEQMDFIVQWGTFLPLSAFIAATCTSLVLLFGGLMQQSGFGGVTVGIVVAFNAYVLLLAQPIRFLGFVILLTTQAIASIRRVFEVLDAPETITNKPSAIAQPIVGHVCFEDVSFAYDDKMVLEHIQLEAKPGQITALLGATGSGKTSIINLIPRFYDVTDGKLTIDGIDVRDFDIHHLRRQIGVVLQDSLLFSATIHENIAYGHPSATREAVIEAAKAANAHDFIMEFPDAYETPVGERGVTLSGGQRQRIAIARALLINPRILILDDATSSVDTQTEFLIQQALERLMVGRTTFIIAQRLSSVLNADQIIVLEDGRIVEKGTHDTLLRLDGLYADIYRLQLEEQERRKHTLEKLDLSDGNGRSTSEIKSVIDRLAGGK